MWILLWIILSAVLIGATAWSTQILFRQKKAWEAYAKKKNLNFTKGTLMGPAEINGVIGEYKVSFFTAERQEADARRRRYITAVEIALGEGLIDGGVAGTKEMLSFMQGLTQIHPFKVEGWNPEHYLFVRNNDVAAAYFTPERIEVFDNVLKTRNADVIIVFNDKELMMRVETSDPMQDPEKIDKIITRLLGLADKMRLSPELRKQYAALA